MTHDYKKTMKMIVTILKFEDQLFTAFDFWVEDNELVVSGKMVKEHKHEK